MRKIWMSLLFCFVYAGILLAEPASPVPKTGQTVSYRPGDDGDLEEGVAWPNPRFTDHGDGTVTDNLTGLEWIKMPHSLPGNSGTMAWDAAVDFCNTLDFSDHSDWRLPSIKELESLVYCGSGSWGDQPVEWLNSSETPFSIAQGQASYWSGTTVVSNIGYAWGVYMYYGDVSARLKVWDDRYVWPVRSGQ